MKRWLFAILLLTGGCVPVAPWQRGVLADRKMQWSAEPERQASRAHALAVREGASGGAAGGGGACGCD